MKRKFATANLIMTALMIIFLVIGCSNDIENPTSTGDSDGIHFAPAAQGGQYALDRFLVEFKAGVDARAISASYNAVILEKISEIDVHILKVPQGSTVREIVRRFNRHPGVKFAEPDYLRHATFIPNDPRGDRQWGLPKIQAPDAWDITKGKKRVTIAILDTGIDKDHEDLARKVWLKLNFTDSSTSDDKFGHGTHCAGIAAAITNNNIGVAGNGFNCSLMNVKVLGDYGFGYDSWIAKGIIWATRLRAKVISMSLGSTAPSTTMENAVNFAWARGVIVVAAAGNGGSSAPHYPAYYENCIAVAATDQNDVKASFSNYGGWVDVAAPGVRIYSTLPNHPHKLGLLNYGYLDGTSMATPFVAGLAGLVWSTAYGTDNASVRNRIESTSDPIPGTGTYWEYGRINDFTAVSP